jgi:hypothetical protein
MLIGMNVNWSVHDEFVVLCGLEQMIEDDAITYFEVMWIGRDDKWSGYDKIYNVMFIGEDVTGSFHDQFEVLCGLEQMIDDDVMTKFEVLCRLVQIWKML